MGSTTFRGYAIPDPGDQPNGLTQIRALAQDIDDDVANLARGFRLLDVLVITSTGTFVKANYPGIREVEVECTGGGGGSGSAAATTGSQKSVGTGGGGASYAYRLLSASDLSASEDVTVGAGGSGGTSGGSGNTGGTTQFGTSALVKAIGGQGGSASGAFTSTGVSGGTAGGSGATGSSGTGSYTVDGDDAPIAFWYNSEVDFTELAGARAGGPFGAITMPQNIFSSFAARAGRGWGSGASGPYNSTSQSARSGAAGSAGLVVVRVYV